MVKSEKEWRMKNHTIPYLASVLLKGARSGDDVEKFFFRIPIMILVVGLISMILIVLGKLNTQNVGDGTFSDLIRDTCCGSMIIGVALAFLSTLLD